MYAMGREIGIQNIDVQLNVSLKATYRTVDRRLIVLFFRVRQFE